MNAPASWSACGLPPLFGMNVPPDLHASLPVGQQPKRQLPFALLPHSKTLRAHLRTASLFNPLTLQPATFPATR